MVSARPFSGTTVNVQQEIPETVQPLGVSGDWTLIWSAFANGENTLDASSFVIAGSTDPDYADPGLTFDYGVQTWDPTLVDVTDGILTCLLVPDSPQPRAGGVATKGKRAFNIFGFIQFDIQVTGILGSWPAVWFQNPTPPDIQEIDAAEVAAWNSTPLTLIHNVITSYDPKIEDPHTYTSDGSVWHTVGVLLQNGVITFYVNGIETKNSSLTFTPTAAFYGLADIASFAGNDSDEGSLKVRNWYYWSGTPT
jgi:hypothetical protein